MTFICASHRDGSSPHTRGARLRLVTHPGRRIIIPAYAGSTVHPGRWSPAPADHPRIRGEHGDRRRVSLGRQVSSPHTRGARIHAAARRWPSDHPRIRGEHRQEGRRQGLVWGSSPHTRGAHPAGQGEQMGGGIIPAYAGSTRLRAFADTRRRDHPRIRGEHSGQSQVAVGFDGSSPHTRGARVQHQPVKAQPRIIPAYAGSTRATARIWRAPRDHPRIRGEHGGGWAWLTIGGGDHPRIRGEHRKCAVTMAPNTGSSPHTRGALRVAARRCFLRWDHPRIRGEHPHAREEQAAAPRIIPAYAGSTWFAIRRARLGEDHPRIRGEHGCRAVYSLGEFGSSPHTRGAPTAK